MYVSPSSCTLLQALRTETTCPPAAWPACHAPRPHLQRLGWYLSDQHTRIMEISSMWLWFGLKGPDSWPLSRSKTTSLSRTEVILCAIVMTVASEKFCRSVLWIMLSVAVSTEAVASSRTSILVRFRITLPRQTSWRWPTLQFSPFSITASKIQRAS